MAKAGWHKHTDGNGGEVVGEQLCVPTAMTAKLWAASSFLFLHPSGSVCCVDGRGVGKKGGKFLWMIPLRCSSLVLEVLEVAWVLEGCFPSGVIAGAGVFRPTGQN